MTTMASQITSLTVFTQPFIQTQIKENIKAPRHWPLCGEFTGTGEFPAQRASYAENVSILWRHHVTGQWSLTLKVWQCPIISCNASCAHVTIRHHFFTVARPVQKKSRDSQGFEWSSHVPMLGFNSCQSSWTLPSNMMPSSNGNIFRVIDSLCSPITGEFPSLRAVTRSFDVFFHLGSNKGLSKQSIYRWFETPSPSLSRHCNEIVANVRSGIFLYDTQKKRSQIWKTHHALTSTQTVISSTSKHTHSGA